MLRGAFGHKPEFPVSGREINNKFCMLRRRRDWQVTIRTPSFKGRIPASARSSVMAAKASGKSGSTCERALQAMLRLEGEHEFSTNDVTLPGKPDVVVLHLKLIIFCDGDFWHGRNLESRIVRLRSGHNHNYWVAKILSNVARDKRNAARLRRQGWSVIRIWESDILKRPQRVVNRIRRVLFLRRCSGGIPNSFDSTPTISGPHS
jgi:DNA mismatch endonuclease (patch repair protein)